MWNKKQNNQFHKNNEMQQIILAFGDPFGIPKSLISDNLLMLNHIESIINLSLKSPGMLLGKHLKKKNFFLI